MHVLCIVRISIEELCPPETLRAQILNHIHTIDHRCNKKGCGEVFVMDGNMKNHRDVCFATNAGYVEYQGLHGRVRSGCPNTPCHKSRYCTVHKPAIAIPQQEQEVGTSTLSSMTSEGEVGMIIGKRNTRQSTLYEVSCYSMLFMVCLRVFGSTYNYSCLANM